MTVAELIRRLQGMPQDARALTNSGDECDAVEIDIIERARAVLNPAGGVVQWEDAANPLSPAELAEGWTVVNVVRIK